MAEHHRLFQTHRTETAVLVVVQIRAADSAPGNAHAKLAGRQRSSLGFGFYAKVFRGVADNGLHEGSPDYSDAVMAPST